MTSEENILALTQEVNRWMENHSFLSQNLRRRVRQELRWVMGVPSVMGKYWVQTMEFQGLSFGPQIVDYTFIRELASIIPEKMILYSGPIPYPTSKKK